MRPCRGGGRRRAAPPPANDEPRLDRPDPQALQPPARSATWIIATVGSVAGCWPRWCCGGLRAEDRKRSKVVVRSQIWGRNRDDLPWRRSCYLRHRPHDRALARIEIIDQSMAQVAIRWPSRSGRTRRVDRHGRQAIRPRKSPPMGTGSRARQRASDAEIEALVPPTTKRSAPPPPTRARL